MSDPFDALERRDAAQRAADLARALPTAVAAAQRLPHWARLLDGVDADAVTDAAALARLPVTRKSALIEAQANDPPLGGVQPNGRAARIFASPGPIHEAQADIPDPWRFARALYATGFRSGDLLHNCFAYHFTPAGFMLDLGAQSLGCTVFPGGTGQSDAQARAAAHLRPRGYAGTPDFLRTVLEAGDALGLDLSSLRLAHVTGGAFTPPLRAWYVERGLTVRQSYGTADLGCVAYESEGGEGLICDEGVIVEIVRPGTGDPVPVGDVGEVVVTVLDPRAPNLRFATGDLSALLPGMSPCGRTAPRLRGWLGRADQAAKVRGMFVRPEQVAEVLRAVRGIGRARLVIGEADGRDAMTLRVEAADAGVAPALEAALASVTRLRGAVEIAAPGSLPNDGRVIDDTRPAPVT